MISKITKKDIISLLDFAKSHKDCDLYYTEKNKRYFLNDLDSINKFLNNIIIGFKCFDTDIRGIAVVWKSLGNRYFLKISANNNKNAKDLLTVLGWNFNNDLYIKINKKNRLLPLLLSKGFHFYGGRGKEILLKREKLITGAITKKTNDYRRY